MRIVHFVSGTEYQSALLSVDAMNLLPAMMTKTYDTKELARLCCKAGLCPLIFKNKLTK
ncbi:hypothetical protein AB1A81_15945 [Bdellovibrio bacteriovorus]|uniref:Uncharacterized protein n=1 Tax=Bdellovibrio bacteriovorus (strain ATCC 15356 / DSM 50701 / NCIMB 9529 / HD100) TaxID=264462 RepID=Q6MHR1_BDEBA|nr:hypothetical protein [Bdellovibrio bacteriovorus]CAE78271.1 hypothetical protein Bd3479 [Bdellovibrio bacteriovorus HD100]